MILNITLENFRKYKKKTIQIDKQHVVIHAPNASGKTTILEAITFLTEGTSAWTNDITDLYRHNGTDQEPHLRISADIDTEDQKQNYSVFQSPTQKKFAIDKHNTTRKKFRSNLATTVFSPEHIELLMLSPQKRREYIDQAIAKIDYNFADQLKQLRKILRQRNAYIKKLSKRFYDSGYIPHQDQQLDYWTKQFADISSQVTYRRQKFVQRLKGDGFRVQYIHSLKLHELEELLQPEELTERIQTQLGENRKREVALGHTVIGAHRDDWSIHTDMEIKRFGSRGEKRMAVGKLIFLIQDILAEELGFYPYLLLDDISSELDKDNTKRILTDDVLPKQQVFLTTVTLEGFPKQFLDNAQIITLD